MDIQNLKVAWGGGPIRAGLFSPPEGTCHGYRLAWQPMPSMGCRRGWKVFLATFFWSEFLGNGVEILHVAHFWRSIAFWLKSWMLLPKVDLNYGRKWFSPNPWNASETWADASPLNMDESSKSALPHDITWWSFRNRFLCQVFPTNIFHQPLGIGDDRSHGWVPSPRGFVQPGTDTWYPWILCWCSTSFKTQPCYGW